LCEAAFVGVLRPLVLNFFDEGIRPTRLSVT